ncbi:50S ribosomal protein L7/L12 [Candidatus Jorgensenbacteria bacterium RIFCSPLOWO2_12_FULL_42_11]|uniref:Large ribosomal subunit protein bL12 n=2 Tax=Parcubacteria group TaxID=1794811 RepID=A0A1F6C1M7_9BACT|nr:MAG: 50S ribosomal protein L7/L12 [Candidatus Jorgensenbacteria bacterium RIFCSPLOWO2_12_FULL_42_11]OHB04843.1 MAG: 50S ribosomal protein L7/L12 [Candidatus Zambryskibacteria bacterium RIFCSPLOWO2_01_FULL_45_43]
MEKFKDIIEKVEKLTVVELAELVKSLEEKFGVSVPTTIGVGTPTSAEPSVGAAEEKTAFNVVLKASGDQKINVIKLIKEATGLGLKEAKNIADGAPKTVKEGMKKEDAEELKKNLEAVGATVEIQ